MSLAILLHFLCTRHVSDINISIIRSLRLCCWITTSVVLFSVRCVLEIWCCWVWVVSVLQAEGFSFILQHGHYSNPAAPNLQHTTNREQKTDVVIQQHSRKLLMIDVLMSETCWVYKKWKKNSKWHQVSLLFFKDSYVWKLGKSKSGDEGLHSVYKQNYLKKKT